MTKINHDQARARDRTRAARHAKRNQSPAGLRQTALVGFVAKHGIGCFKCEATLTRWAKTGTNQHGPWAICTTCLTQAD